MVGQSNLMPGQLPGYARVWLRLWVKHQLVVFILKIKMEKADLVGQRELLAPSRKILIYVSSSCIHKYNKQNKQYMTV